MKLKTPKSVKSKKPLLGMLIIALSVVIWNWPTTPESLLQTSHQKSSSSRAKEMEISVPETVREAVTPVAAAPSADPQRVMAEVVDFRNWANSYLAAPLDQRAAMLKNGEEFAKMHTQRIAEMIRLDPEQAIANAVPMVIRQDLPPSIVELLEKRVNLKAALTVNGNAPLPGQENSPDFKPYTRLVSTEDGDHWNAYVYGKRGQQRSLDSTYINGISVGYDMAVADSTVRQLEVGERPVPGDREVVESCPVSKEETVVARTDSGTLPPVTAETPAFETAERVIYVCSGGHIEQVADEYATEEERAHWEARGATLNAGAGSGAPTGPISAIPGGATTGHRKLLYIRVTFPDHMIDPQSEAECHDSLRQLADYISKTSYGRCYFTYTVAPLIVLPYPESWYVQHQNDGAAGDSILRNHAITLARAAGYDNLAYNNEVIRWNGAVGSYGGSAGVGGRNMNLKTNSVGTLLHELGHNLGLWHANYWQTNPPSSIGPGSNGEYGNTFDLLGNSGSMGQFTSYFKSAMGWLPNDNHWTVNSPGLYRIHQFDYPIADPSFRYAIRIRKDNERDYWAEFRQLHTTNTGFMNGLMLTWDRWGQGNIGGSGGAPGNGSNGGAQLLDMTPGSFGHGITDTRNDSALWVGRTFSDTDANIHITPVAKNTSTVPPSMDVYIYTGDVSGNDAPTLSIAASNTSVATNTSITLTATATDPNGDALAYAWVFNDGTYSTNNSSVQTKSWTTAGFYQVLCTASDMKGKRTTRAILISVGSPNTFTVSGNITGPDSLPLEGVYVASHAPSNGTSHPSSSTFKGTWTDSDGNYTLTGLTAASYTISPNLYPNVFTASGFSNPVVVGPSTTGKNFTSTSLPTIAINITDAIANEGTAPGTGTIRIERSGSTASALSVQIFNSNSGTATRNTDYSLSPAPTASTAGGGSGTSEYIIPAGASFLDITVTPVNDSTAEGIEYAALDFANTSGGYILAGSAVANVEIIDDENSNLPVVKLTQLDNVASETGFDTATLKLERNGSTTANLTVNLTMTGTATNGTDYTIPSSVIIPAGSATVNFTITPIDDVAQESTETCIVTIATNAAYARDTLSNNQTVTIHDNDLPVLTIAATDATLTETAGDKGVFTITRAGGNPYQELIVDYAISGRAVHGADYRRLEGRSIIPAGASTTTVEIYPYDDAVDEGIQDVILQLRSTTAYSIGGSGTATMSITDNDDSQVYVKLTQSGVIEPATGSVTAVAYQIIRPISGAAIMVNYAMSGTAINGVDYTTLPGTIAFAAGDTTKTINVSALADSVFEDAESVTLTLLPGTGYTLMTSQIPSATGTIVDGDQPTLDVSAANTVTTLTTQGSETSASLRFIISRDVTVASDLIVNYTMSGTATEGVDYTGTTGTATILAGTASVYITIVPVNDTIAEGVENIVMNITPATGTYGLRTPVATMLLGDNDAFTSGAVAFAATTSTTNEAAGSHNVAVNVTGTPAGIITVGYRLSAGTATGGGYDFSYSNGTLTFPPGTTTQNIPFTIHPDLLAEPAETIVIQLYNVIGANLGTSTHTVTLNNLSMPEAFTDAATNLLANSVTINGRVLPNALATNAWFEYGPTSAYGSSTAPQSIGIGTTSVSVNAALSGFAPGGYHYRCVAQNSAGTTYGINQVVSSSNANLAAIVTSSGTFTPAFDTATLVYSVMVPPEITAVTVTPTVAQANASVKVNGVTTNSGSPSQSIVLGAGTTQIDVVVTAQDGITTKSYTLNVAVQTTGAPQTITFGSLPPKAFGDPPFALAAAASSGLPVSYASSNPAVATVSGSTVTIIAAGNTTFTATQAGNGTYAAAPPVNQTLTVNPASQTITFGALSSVPDDAAPFALTASASSGLTVSFASSDPAVATVSGNTLTVVGMGTTIITASQSGNSNYNAATPVPQTLTVVRANPLAVAGGPYNIVINQSLSLNGSASLASHGETISSYEWDLNNDSTFGDAIGATPSAISFANLTGSWGMIQGANTIQLKVTDTAGKTSTISATVQILTGLTWDANGTTAGQTNGAGAWLGANFWWNGSSNQAWASGSNATFGGLNTAGGAVTLGSPTSVNFINFNTFTGTYTVGTTGQELTINGGISKAATSAAVTFVSPVAVGADQTWSNNSTGLLSLNAAVNNNGYTLTFDGSGTTSLAANVNSVITGAGGIIMNGTGRLQLGSGQVPIHTYSGATILNAGVTMVSNNNLGTGNLTLNGGVIESYWATNFIRGLGAGAGEMQLTGGASGFAVNGSTGASVILGNNAANEAVWGSAYFNPSILVLQTPYSQGTSTITFQNKIDLNGTTRIIETSGGVSGSATSTISGVIRNSTGTAGIIKNGNGLLILSGANTYNGTTTVNSGILDFAAASLGFGSGSGRSISVAAGAAVKRNALDNAFLSRIIETPDEFALMTNATNNNLDFSGGAGANVPNAFLGNWASNGAKTEYGGLITPGGGNYRIGAKGSSGLLAIVGTNRLTGSNNLVVGGTGANGIRVMVAGANNFSGETVINSGAKLTLGNNLALQNSVLNLGSAGGSFALNTAGTVTGATIAASPTFGGLSGSRNLLTAFTNSGGNNESNLAATAVTGFTVNPGTGLTVSYSGSIVDFAAGTTLTKSGLGTQILAGVNTFTGATNINEGTLLIDGSLSNFAASLNVNAGATLGGTGTIGRNVSIADGGKLEFNISTTSVSHNSLAISAGRSFDFIGSSELTITSSGSAVPGTYTLISGGNIITGAAPTTVNLPENWVATVSVSGNSLLLNLISTSGDIIPPALVDIVDDKGGAAILVNTQVTYTITFSEDIDDTTVIAADFGNAGTAVGVIESVTETTPGVFLVSVTPITSGSLRLKVNAGAVINDVAGNAMNTASDITDDTIITVMPLNTAPMANSQSVTTAEDTALPITLTGSDAELDPLSFTIVSLPSNGTLSGNVPNLTYTPSANFNGSDSFTFTVNDGTLESALATVSLNVSAVNDTPDAIAQNVSTPEDTAKAINLAGTDVDLNTLTYIIVSQPANGTLSGSGPNVTFNPTADYNGSDSFTFKVNDGTIDSAIAVVSINVTAVNDAPVAIAQSFSTAEDTAKAITLSGTDVDLNSLTYVIISQPGNGTLSGSVPNLTYMPTADYNGSDSFTFKVNDGTIDSALVTVSITVTAVNDTPVAIAQSVSTDEDAAVPITLTGTDAENSMLTYAIVSQPTNGTLSGSAPNLTYTPTADYNGSDSFTFKINDGTIDSSVATVSINVDAVNDTPAFITNPIIAAGAAEGISYSGETLAGRVNDSDTGDTITYTKVSGPAWLAVAGNGALSGTPPAGSSGLNSFVVRAADSASATADATLEITVTGLPLPWISTDIGTGMLAGSTTFNAGTFTQAGSGVIGGTSDRLRYTYQTLTGDGEIRVRISGLQNTGSAARVGVMIRDSLAPNSKEIFMGMTNSNAYRWVRRTATGGNTSSSNSNNGTVPNTWVRLVRSGTTITAYKSTNGTSWTTVGSTTNTTFSATCYIGLAVGSGSVTTLNTSQFSNVSVTP